MKKKLIAIGGSLLLALSVTSSASASPEDCAELFRLWSVYTSAQNAENDYDYWGELDRAHTDFNLCQGWAMNSGNPSQAVRECEEAYYDRQQQVESGYNYVHNSVLEASAAYYFYLAQLTAQQEYCSY